MVILAAVSESGISFRVNSAVLELRPLGMLFACINRYLNRLQVRSDLSCFSLHIDW